MAALRLTMSTWDYDRVRAIIDRRVTVEGCEVVHTSLPPEECFRRALTMQEFDVTELGLGMYLAACAQGTSPYVGIPVFTSRMFRHSAIYVRTDRGIQSPADLRGKRIGVWYQSAAALWVNGLLQDEHGVRPEEIQWYEQADAHGMPLSLPEGFPLSRLAPGQLIDALLESGELDGFIGPRTPRCYHDGKTPLARLFDEFEVVEKDYYRRTGIYPIMHVVGIRRDVHEAHPRLAEQLCAAFEEAKQLAQAELFETAALKVTLPWLLSASRDAQEVLGPDFWPYGIERNRVTLEAAIRYAVDQGIARRRVTIEELFAPSTLAL